MPDETKEQQPVEQQPVQDAQQADQNQEQQEVKDNLPETQVDVEDAGVLRKKITVTVARERIDAKLGEMFGDLSKTALVPGFRIGHAPRRLIEKRFGQDVSEDVRNALIGEAIGHAVEKSKINTLGDPEIDLSKIKLPDAGAMSFSFEVEVSPEFDLPELKGIAVEKPRIEITDQRIVEQMDRLREMRATYQPTDEAAADGDAITADVKISGEGVAEVSRSGVNLRVAPAQVEGIPLVELGKALAGKKASQTASLTAKVSQAHPNEAWRDKELTVAVTINQVRRRILPELNDEFARGMGLDSLELLRAKVHAGMQASIDTEIRGAMRAQVEKYLLDNVKLDLPEGMLSRHTRNLLVRRYLTLMERGVPRERIDEHLTELQTDVSEQAQRDVRLRFILAEVINKLKIEATDGEVNAYITAIARQYERRPERMRQELEAEGSLQGVAVAICEDKALDALLADAKIVELTEEELAERAKQAKQEEPQEASDDKAQQAKKPAESKKTKKAAPKKTDEEKADQEADKPQKASAKTKKAGKAKEDKKEDKDDQPSDKKKKPKTKKPSHDKE